MNVEPQGGCLNILLMLFAGLFGLVFWGISPIVNTLPDPANAAPNPLTQELIFEVQGDADTETISRTAAIFEQRLSALGVSGYYVVWDADAAAITVQISADADAQLVADTLSTSALLEFVDVSALSQEALAALPGAYILTTAQPDFDLTLPPGALTQPDGTPFPTILTGAALDAAGISNDATGSGWAVGFTLTDEGAATFGSFTESHIGLPLAIVLDGQVLSAPIIQSRLDREGVISGNFTEQDVRLLSLQLNSGPLPAPVTLQSINIIAPE